MDPFVEDIPVTVGADNRAAMNDDAMTDLGARIKEDVWVKGDIIANPTVAAEVVGGHEHGAGADPDTGANNAAGADVGCGIDVCPSINGGCRMDPRRVRVRWKEHRRSEEHTSELQ